MVGILVDENLSSCEAINILPKINVCFVQFIVYHVSMFYLE